MIVARQWRVRGSDLRSEQPRELECCNDRNERISVVGRNGGEKFIGGKKENDCGKFKNGDTLDATLTEPLNSKA